MTNTQVKPSTPSRPVRVSGWPREVLGELVAEFLEDLAVQGKAPNTIRVYGNDLRRFALSVSTPLGAATLARHRVSLRSFSGGPSEWA